MKKLQTTIFAIASFTFFSGTVAAAPVEIGHTRITYAAQGSPNSIAGTWSTVPFSIAAEAAVEFFELEFISFTSEFGSPNSVSFVSYLPSNPAGLYFCDVTRNSACVASPSPGEVGLVHPSDQAWTFVSRLFDSVRYPMTGNVGVTFNSGGPYAQATGELKITAMGVAAPVPEPSTLAMALMGFGVVGLARRNGASGRTKT